MRTVLGAVAGLALGWVGPQALAGALSRLLADAGDVLSDELRALATLSPWAPGPIVAALSAVVAAAGVALLLASVVESVAAGRGARSLATLALLVVGLGSLWTPDGAGPFTVVTLTGAVAVAVLPRRWALLSLALITGTAAGVWARDALGERALITEHAHALSQTVGHLDTHVWTLGLLTIVTAGYLFALRLVMFGPKKPSADEPQPS